MPALVEDAQTQRGCGGIGIELSHRTQLSYIRRISTNSFELGSQSTITRVCNALVGCSSPSCSGNAITRGVMGS
jgi:hypothetical protein